MATLIGKPAKVFGMQGFNKAHLYQFSLFDAFYCSCERRIFSLRRDSIYFGWCYLSMRRGMATSKRVQDRSHNKRIHDLEIVIEKWKIAYKVIFLMEILKKEPEMIIPIRNLEQYRSQINLPKPHKVSDFIRKSPRLFELYKDQRGVLWCGMTKDAENLLEAEEQIIKEHSDKAAEYVTRFLMMSVDKRLPLDKIAHFRRDFGLPKDFRINWVHRYPHLFKMVKFEDDIEYLELESWNPGWAITELEKKVMGITEANSQTPGVLSLSFPMKFPPNYKKVYRYGGKIAHFQKRSYLSPYADARGLKAGSEEFNKRAVAVFHELLSFTVEKKLVTDHLTHFRRELVMPQKLMRLLLKHCGIFYVSERGKRFSVFLTEAYEGSELIEKGPLVLWKERVQSLIGYRGRKKKMETYVDVLDMEMDGLTENHSDEDSIQMKVDPEDAVGLVENALHTEESEMDVGEMSSDFDVI